MNRHITLDPKICNGKPVIKNTCIPITVILDQLADTGSIDGVVQKYPELTFEQVTAALRCCQSVINHTELESIAA